MSHEIYDTKFEEYINKIKSNNFYIQILITKCCGYSFLTHIKKNAKLNELYKLTSNELDSIKEIKLYSNNILVPKTEEFLKSYISNNNMKPFYNMPSPVVYNFMVDDGHHHDFCDKFKSNH
tara:strand:+ start:494 stop:856 length:363 start_codon:yes stop_codon:yes gene_type:complete